jgi:hypothetical protein
LYAWFPVPGAGARHFAECPSQTPLFETGNPQNPEFPPYARQPSKKLSKIFISLYNFNQKVIRKLKKTENTEGNDTPYLGEECEYLGTFASFRKSRSDWFWCIL